MNRYRVTVRHGRPARYHVEDVQASSLPEALQVAAERMPEEVALDADLAEVRLGLDPEERQFGPG